MRKIRLIYWVVMVLLLACGMVGANPRFQNDSLAAFGFFGMVAWWFQGARFARWIAVLITTSVRCKNCGLEIPAVGQWNIGSFHDHRHRHIYAAKSPIDGARIGHINCPQCECTILV